MLVDVGLLGAAEVRMVVMKYCGNTSAKEESGCKTTSLTGGPANYNRCPQVQYTVTSSKKKKKEWAKLTQIAQPAP